MSEADWQRQRAVYAMLERARGKGVAAFDNPSFAPALHKVWLAPGVRVLRYWIHESSGYVYVLEKFDDHRYESWQTADGDLSGAPTPSPSKTSLPNSSGSPDSPDGCESTDSH